MSRKRSIALEILAPSFMSGTVSAIFSISVIAAVLTPFFHLGDYLQQYREAIRLYSGTLLETYARIAAQLNSSELVANIAIFCTWAMVGLAVYYLLLLLLSLFIDIMTFAELLGFKNTNKKTLITQVVEQFATRASGVVGLAVFLWFAFEVLAPVIPTLIAAALSSSPIMGALYLLSAAVFLAAGVHVVVVLFRVIFLRVRLISTIYNRSFN